MNPRQLVESNLLALCIWREARGEAQEGKLAVGCSIRNRTHKPGWWGYDYTSVITKPYQYSSFNGNDPNSAKWPEADDPSWQASVNAAKDVLSGHPDTTDGADSYFDSSLDGKPPGWAQQTTAQHMVSIGRLRFWRTR